MRGAYESLHGEMACRSHGDRAGNVAARGGGEVLHHVRGGAGGDGVSRHLPGDNVRFMVFEQQTSRGGGETAVAVENVDIDLDQLAVADQPRDSDAINTLGV